MVAALLLAGWTWVLPAGFPLPHVTPDNRMSEAKFELGRHLFHDPRLSANGTQSCASCHQQSRAFTDGRPKAIGSTGQVHSRNAMTLTNVAYNVSFTWDDPRVRSLERQARVPLFNEHPIEMGMKGREREILARLRADVRYRTMFREAFPGERRPIGVANVVRAIATFERALVSGRSPWDRAAFDGEHDALSPEAWRGVEIFFSERAGCASCHAGFNFSGPVRHVGSVRALPELVSNGVTPGRFRVPTLRNVELTAPYMHDGSLAALEDVIARYDDARGLGLDAAARADLAAFLRSLTDRAFVGDPRLSDPWQEPSGGDPPGRTIPPSPASPSSAAGDVPDPLADPSGA
ncbi:MAG TPA: cytochrome c peroxidase [Thermoanaerobaculia bacterium]|nr:cytochrome c peroxidase [Thermoanaerobaculia bacterium]